jgi:IclR family transcriptional regulator, KDG regulon repressor
VNLRDVTGETTQIAILADWQIVYLERVLSTQAVGYMTSRAGTVLPAYCTGLGKVLLAFQPEEAVRAWAMKQSFSRLTPNTITSAKALMSELREIRLRGYATDDEEREHGVRCIAAPIIDHTGEVVAAISVAGPSERMPQQLVGSDVANQVLAAAAAISQRIGWQLPAGVPEAG